AADQVRPGSCGRVSDGRLPPPLRRPPGDPRGAHQPGDALAPMPVPAAGQLGVDPRAAVTPLGLLVDGPDLPAETSVRAIPPGRASQVLAAGGTGDLQQPAPGRRCACTSSPPR